MSDLTKLISAHNGDMALLYIWLKVNGTLSFENAARDLCMPVKRIETALEMLNLYKIEVSVEPSSPVVEPSPSIGNGSESTRRIQTQEVKDYTSSELKEATENDPIFASIQDEATQCLGKVLSKDDLSKLLDIYNNLGMDPEVIFVLLHYCKSISEKVRFSMFNVSKRAYMWNDMGIDTVEKAEAYVERMRSMSKRENKIKSIMKIDYDLTTKQREFVEKWVDASYSDDMIKTAYEITLEKTNKLAWSYMDKVLQNMSEKTASQSEKDAALVGRSLPDSLRGKAK